jgi:hypothetical protein
MSPRSLLQLQLLHPLFSSDVPQPQLQRAPRLRLHPVRPARLGTWLRRLHVQQQRLLRYLSHSLLCADVVVGCAPESTRVFTGCEQVYHDEQ